MRKGFIFSLIFIACCFLYTDIVNADAGPKPSITVRAKNMPDTECYMDLLVKDPSYKIDPNYFNEPKYNQELVTRLKNYYENGWRPLLAGGNRLTHGDIICDVKDGKCTLNYTYSVPNRFKIIVVTGDGDIVVSNEINRKGFDSIIYFDFETGKAVEGPLLISYLLAFLVTCSITLITEGLVLRLFGFSIRKNLKPLLLINIATQILLIIQVSFGMYIMGILGALFFLLLAEILILIFESILFANLLKQHSKPRRVMFSITANIASFIAGIIITIQVG